MKYEVPRVDVTPGGAFGSFIAACRAGKPEMSNADMDVAHHSCVVGHLMNNSYRLGKKVPFNAKAGQFGDHKDAYEHFMKLHEIMRDGVGVPEDQAGLPGGKMPFMPKDVSCTPYQIVIAGKNFGCGSSREHAPAALNISGVTAVVAQSYARIFYRNAVDGGFLVPFESTPDLSQLVRTGDEITIRTDINLLTNETTGKAYALNPLGEVAAIVEAGGIFGYARENNLMSK